MRGEGAENAWRCRDSYVGTQKRLRRHAVGATSGRSFRRHSKKKKVIKVTKVTGNKSHWQQLQKGDKVTRHF